MKLGCRKCSSSPAEDVISGIGKVYRVAVNFMFIQTLENDLFARKKI
jgi:hypothetical protein